MTPIEFKLQTFEGPLDLLLHLISKNKVSLYDIPIAEITEQYIDYIHAMERFDIEVSSEFLVVASNLLYIKSKMILPNEEDEEVEDPRAELAQRLLEYKKIKCAAVELTPRQFAGTYNFFKVRGYIEPIVIDESLKRVTADKLFEAINNVSQAIKLRKPVVPGNFAGIVGRELTSVFSVVKKFVKRLKMFKKVKFLDLFKGIKTREEAVASFLAVLEMVKMDRIDVEQTGTGYVLSYRERVRTKEKEEANGEGNDRVDS